ncbi:ORF_111 [Adoxophyes orana granulovirus]|uniref:ADOR112 n=1 Tax=Adoxophyes orana granulovirus TaxID=170617 RepID=Q7T9Q4_GVAO|nr:ORF_111 [Adoxophyes orana granulovirus]AAP85748.1 ORF_111 [Adoxophyes orana granulovirus]AJA91752.1 ADOR112 [Adoxophyes orana granulovirus]
MTIITSINCNTQFIRLNIMDVCLYSSLMLLTGADRHSTAITNRIRKNMFFFITENDYKNTVEEMINNQFTTMECVICLNEINNINSGVIYITDGGTADLERIMCSLCDKRFKAKDPYYRQINYRFVYPFETNDHAQAFVNKSKQFVINEGDENKIEHFKTSIKNANCIRDVDYTVKLTI